MDRIDLHLNVPRPSADILAGGGPPGEASAVVRERVIAARAIQLERGVLNSDLSSEQFKDDAFTKNAARELLKQAAEQKALSARGWFRALKVARTIADLDSAAKIESQHMAEALTLRVPQL